MAIRCRSTVRTAFGADETRPPVQRWFRRRHATSATDAAAAGRGGHRADRLAGQCHDAADRDPLDGRQLYGERTDHEHYHVVVGGTGELDRGDHPISDNSNTSDNDYAAHTKNCNTQSIGISAACMAGAIESPFSPVHIRSSKRNGRR